MSDRYDFYGNPINPADLEWTSLEVMVDDIGDLMAQAHARLEAKVQQCPLPFDDQSKFELLAEWHQETSDTLWNFIDKEGKV